MEKPGEMIRRAQAMRQRLLRSWPDPAPAPPPDVPRHVPPPAGHKAAYQALMRSHDRVHTCHLGGQGR